jgi:hypothetical protein
MEENDNIDKNYISLFEASKLCSYSEPYLRLRARQGKLKSIKLGKKWMTTARWIDQYSARIQEWREMSEAKKRSLPVAALVEAPGELSINLEQESVLQNEPATLSQAVFADVVQNEKTSTVFCSGPSLIVPPKPARRLAAFPPSGQIFPVPKETLNNDIASFGWFGALLSGALCALLLFLAISGGGSGFAGAEPLRFGQANAQAALFDIGSVSDQSLEIAASLKQGLKNLSFEIVSDNSLKDLVGSVDRFFGGK